MGLRLFHNHKKLWAALALGFWGGTSAVLVDIDHWFNLTSFKGWGMAGRPLHVPLAIIACCLGICSYSCLRGLSAKMVLKRALIFLAIVAVLVGLEILWAMYMGDA